jgi:DNA-binding PadR family transcriptional regulator
MEAKPAHLSPTARVILGLLAAAPRSGYDIKGVVDNSTRFFWAASYGQIYPELKRLAEQGLIAAEAAPEGGRRRTTFRITDEGRDALTAWVRDPDLVNEMRDEGLLKVFFVGLLEREDAIAVLEAAREKYAEKLARLREIEPLAAGADRFGPLEVLQYGLGMSEFGVKWCDENLKKLREMD